MQLHDDIKHLITERHSNSNGNCGLTIIEICNALKLTYNDIKPALTDLYRDKFYIIRQGLNHKLIFLNK